MAITFDGATKLITLTSGTVALDVADLYSRWKDWVLLSDNAKWLPAFSTVGGETIDPGAGTTVPLYAFLVNGWRLKPQEANHTLNVSGGVLLVDGGGDPFVNTTGAFTVRINYQQPVQAITVATGGGGGGSLTAADVWAYAARTLTASPIAPADIWQYLVESGYSAEEVLRVIAAAVAGKSNGAGTGTRRYRDLADTKDRITGSVANGDRTAVVLDVDP